MYNENDPKAAAWLRELMKHGLIPHGTVDERSIVDLTPADCAPTSHFFAGIGGWPYALKLAGWPEDRSVWTGSCPCQPFSAAGKRQGTADSRHLWPVWFRLIQERRPVTIFGEQVASAVGHGWLDGVFADLEGEGYTCGAVVLGAHSVGAPHIRQRLYWVAFTASEQVGRTGQSRELSDERLEFSKSNGRLERGTESSGRGAESRCESGGVGDSDSTRSQGRIVKRNGADERAIGTAGLDFWTPSDLLPCTDGKSRRVEPGTFPLAHGVPARVGRLRGYGNAIVPQVAAAFVRTFMEIGI